MNSKVNRGIPKAESIFAYVLLLLIFGCATLSPEPFNQFSSSVKEAQTGIDEGMTITYNWTRAGFLEGFSSDQNANFSQLIIVPGKGYDWQWTIDPQPVYLTIRKTQLAVLELTSAFVDYASLLAKLAGNELVSTETFEQLAKDLNKNANDAVKALKLDVSTTNIAILSTAASELLRSYIENKRQEYLRDAILDNQQNIQDYSNICISLIHTIRGAIKTYYAERYEPIRIAWDSSTGVKRLKETQKMINLNEQFVDTIRVLQELEIAYSSLPKAHADLAKSIENPTLSLDDIQTLYSSAKRLQRLYNELKEAESENQN